MRPTSPGDAGVVQRRSWTWLLVPLTLAAIGLTAVGPAGSALTSPRDALDWPVRLGVSPASQVYVALNTDTVTGNVVQFSASLGQVVRRWSLPEYIDDLAVAADGRVYVLLDGANRVERFAGDGSPEGGWPLLEEGLTLATGSLGRSLGGSLYLLGLSPVSGDAPQVTRFDPGGGELSRFSAAASAQDITTGSAPDAPDGVVHVVDDSQSAQSGRSRVAGYLPDGSFRKSVFMRGAVYGLGVDNQGTLSVAVAPAGLLERWVDRFASDGTALGGWRLPDGEVLDLAVDPRLGDVYVILDDDVLRYAADGTLLGRLTREQLNLWPATPTVTVSASSTGIVATRTATLTATSTTTPTATRTDRSTATVTGSPTEDAGWVLALPAALRP